MLFHYSTASQEEIVRTLAGSRFEKLLLVKRQQHQNGNEENSEDNFFSLFRSVLLFEMANWISLMPVSPQAA